VPDEEKRVRERLRREIDEQRDADEPRSTAPDAGS
jgi:hypothetical protein